jgi:hypothetical protein
MFYGVRIENKVEMKEDHLYIFGVFHGSSNLCHLPLLCAGDAIFILARSGGKAILEAST